jgi:apolipoprotein N-acyltransferase
MEDVPMNRIKTFIIKQDIFILAAGSLLLAFVGFRFNVPPAAWFAPVFLLRYFRHARGAGAILIGYLAMSISLGISMYGLIPAPPAVQILIGLVWWAMFVTPYLVDRFFYAHTGPVAGLFIFPGAYVLLEYILSVSPFSSLTSMAYSQFPFKGLMQIVSITGTGGVTFLITWFASLVNLLREENFSPRRARVPGIAFALILGVTLVAGNLRLAGQPERSVPIGSVTVSYDAYIDMWDFSVYIESGTDPARVPEMKKISSLTADALFRESESLARAGAKIILWSEINVFLFPDQEKAFTKRARDFARKEGVYLIAAAARLTPGTDMYENWAAAFTPAGEAAFTYLKSHPVFAEFGGEHAVRGNGRIPLLDTPYGRIAVAICYDMDFPRLIRQAGRGGADIILVPALDWKEISPYHSYVALVRGIENGVSVVRQTDQGMSLAGDYRGLVTASMDFFSAEKRVMLSHLPASGVRTLYPYAGDWIVWGILLFWGGYILLNTIVRRKNRERGL